MAQGIKGLPEKRREDTGQGETATRMWQPPPSPVTDPEEATCRTSFFRGNPFALDGPDKGFFRGSPTVPLTGQTIRSPIFP